MTNIKINDPQKGEIWQVNFNPIKGMEIGKVRPALVINERFIGQLRNRIVLPITESNLKKSQRPWMLKLNKSNLNGLSKDSAVDASQIKSVSVERFSEKSGEITSKQLEEALGKVALCIGFEG